MTSSLFLSYFPIPIFLTAIYSLLVCTASSESLIRVRSRILHLLLWFNLLGIPIIFSIGHIVFLQSTQVFDAVRLGFLFGAFSSSPFLLVMLKAKAHFANEEPS